MHKIKIGTLVETKYKEYFEDGACWSVHGKLFVVDHTFDKNGDPTYSLSKFKDPKFAKGTGQIKCGFFEHELKIVEKA